MKHGPYCSYTEDRTLSLCSSDDRFYPVLSLTETRQLLASEENRALTHAGSKGLLENALEADVAADAAHEDALQASLQSCLPSATSLSTTWLATRALDGLFGRRAA
jgi:hypothetical protein